MFLIHKVNVIRTDQFDIIFPGIFYQFGICPLLQRVGFMVGTGHGRPMSLQLQIIIFSKEVLVPAYSLFRFFKLVIKYLLRYFTTDTGRADNQSLMILFQFIAVGTGAHIVSICPGSGYQLYQVVITFLILCQHNQVPAALVGFTFLFVHSAACHIHLATDYRFEQLIFSFRNLSAAVGKFRFLIFASYLAALDTGNPLLEILNISFRSAILLIDVIGKLLDAEHITVISYGNTLHSILHRLVNQRTYTGLTVEEGILGMNVQMNKILHKYLLSIESIKVQPI